MIVNKTVNDRKAIHEVTRKIGKSAYKYCAVLSVILLGVVIFEFFTTKLDTFAIFGFIAVVAGIMIWEFAYNKIKNSEIRSMNQIKEIYGEESYETIITFLEDKVSVQTPTTTKDILKKDIEKYEETENYFIIYYSGKNYLIVAKAGFVSGSEKELIKYLG